MERVVPALIVLGMIASLVAFLSLREAVITQTKSDQLFATNIIKSLTYYIAYAAEIVLLLSAGLISLASADFRSITRGYRLRFLLLLGAVLIMTARGYTFADVLSTKLVDGTGPFPFVISALMFFGSRRANWIFLGRVILFMAVLFSVLVLLGMARLQIFTRQEAVLNLQISLNALYWPASWIFLKQFPQPSLASRLRFVPVLIYGVGSLLTQTRLNFVMFFALVAVYAYLQRRRKAPQAALWAAALASVVWVGLLTPAFLRDTRIFERIDAVAEAFSSRLNEDTRTGQFVSFFEDVQPHELLLGRGSFATWIWGGLPYSGGTDVGYLTLLFYGGVPLLLTYAAALLLPGITLLRKKVREDWQLTAAGIVLLWSIRMFSSDYPAATLGYYVVLFCVGACISKDCCARARQIPA